MARVRKQSQKKDINPQIWRTALYIRLSKEDGNDVSYSVINQKQRLLDYIGNSNEQFEVVDYFIDDGKTGTDSNRTAFQAMLHQIEIGQINCVIVKDLSRLSRNYIEAGHYMEQFFVDRDVRFISLELPNLDSVRFPDQMNSVLVPIQNVMNDDFCRQTSIKIRGVLQMKRSRGEFTGAFAPYGYSKDPDNKHHLVIDKEAAHVVKDIFYWYVYDGMSKNAIAKKLNALGILNPSLYKRKNGFKYCSSHKDQNDGLWSPSTIAHILKNQVYIGHMVQGRHRIKSYKVHKQMAVPEEEWVVVKNTHKPLIKKDVFEKAQLLQQKDTRAAPKQKYHYMLSGFVRCGKCNKSMTRRTAKNLVYYACRTYREKSQQACTKQSVREDMLQKIVLQVLNLQLQFLNNAKDIKQKIEQLPINHAHILYLQNAQQQHQQTLAHLHNKLDGLYLDWKIGEVSKEMYKRIQERLEQQISVEQQSIKEIDIELAMLLQQLERPNPYVESFLKQQQLYFLKRSTIIDFLEVIYVNDKKEIELVFAFRDPFQSIEKDTKIDC